ncbi:hypothetical protein H4Q26_004066 [Puccinia striiformis f. sp. tritici PST-130]|nr:hypothetical protein H4Q26_004066 [Puccinia striiformis f. sp. tritici PST-130]
MGKGLDITISHTPHRHSSTPPSDPERWKRKSRFSGDIGRLTKYSRPADCYSIVAAIPSFRQVVPPLHPRLRFSAYTGSSSGPKFLPSPSNGIDRLVRLLRLLNRFPAFVMGVAAPLSCQELDSRAPRRLPDDPGPSFPGVLACTFGAWLRLAQRLRPALSWYHFLIIVLPPDDEYKRRSYDRGFFSLISPFHQLLRHPSFPVFNHTQLIHPYFPVTPCLPLLPVTTSPTPFHLTLPVILTTRVLLIATASDPEFPLERQWGPSGSSPEETARIGALLRPVSLTVKLVVNLTAEVPQGVVENGPVVSPARGVNSGGLRSNRFVLTPRSNEPVFYRTPLPNPTPTWSSSNTIFPDLVIRPKAYGPFSKPPVVPNTPPGLRMVMDLPEPEVPPFVLGQAALDDIFMYLQGNDAVADPEPEVPPVPIVPDAEPAGFEPSQTAIHWADHRHTSISSDHSDSKSSRPSTADTTESNSYQDVQFHRLNDEQIHLLLGDHTRINRYNVDRFSIINNENKYLFVAIGFINYCLVIPRRTGLSSVIELFSFEC